jgi:hypothetical protein
MLFNSHLRITVACLARYVWMFSSLSQGRFMMFTREFRRDYSYLVSTSFDHQTHKTSKFPKIKKDRFCQVVLRCCLVPSAEDRSAKRSRTSLAQPEPLCHRPLHGDVKTFQDFGGFGRKLTFFTLFTTRNRGSEVMISIYSHHLTPFRDWKRKQQPVTSDMKKMWRQCEATASCATGPPTQAVAQQLQLLWVATLASYCSRSAKVPYSRLCMHNLTLSKSTTLEGSGLPKLRCTYVIYVTAFNFIYVWCIFWRKVVALVCICCGMFCICCGICLHLLWHLFRFALHICLQMYWHKP